MWKASCCLSLWDRPHQSKLDCAGQYDKGALGLSVATFIRAWRGPCLESHVPIIVSVLEGPVTSELRVNCTAQGEEGVSQEALPDSDQAKKDQITCYVSPSFTH